MSKQIVGTDFYFRRGNGPVQHARVWDGKKFLESQVHQGLNNKDGGKPAPYDVTPATAEEFIKQREKK